MQSNDKLKDIDIKNRTCYYFDDIIKIEDLDLDNILLGEKSYGKFLVYTISYKERMPSKFSSLFQGFLRT